MSTWKLKSTLEQPHILNKAAECPKTKRESPPNTLWPCSIGPYITSVITEPSGWLSKLIKCHLPDNKEIVTTAGYSNPDLSFHTATNITCQGAAHPSIDRFSFSSTQTPMIECSFKKWLLTSLMALYYRTIKFNSGKKENYCTYCTPSTWKQKPNFNTNILLVPLCK